MKGATPATPPAPPTPLASPPPPAAPAALATPVAPAALAAPVAPAEDAAREEATSPAAVDPARRIARLEGRVAALEAALERRSHELRLLQRFLGRRALAQLARLVAGLRPLPLIACEPIFWHETRDLTAAEVPETLEDLWASVAPRVLPR